MRIVSKRFSIPADQLELAEEYAQLTNRTLSELIVESLFQIRHRYPARHEKRVKSSLADRIAALERKIEQGYVPQRYRAKKRGVSG